MRNSGLLLFVIAASGVVTNLHAEETSGVDIVPDIVYGHKLVLCN